MARSTCLSHHFITVSSYLSMAVLAITHRRARTRVQTQYTSTPPPPHTHLPPTHSQNHYSNRVDVADRKGWRGTRLVCPAPPGSVEEEEGRLLECPARTHWLPTGDFLCPRCVRVGGGGGACSPDFSRGLQSSALVRSNPVQCCISPHPAFPLHMWLP